MNYVALVDYPEKSASYDIELIGVFDNLVDAIDACRTSFDLVVEEGGPDGINEFYGEPGNWSNHAEARIVGCYADAQWFVITKF